MSGKCPACGKAKPPDVDPKLRPFCSARCRTIDLGSWIDEKYRLPSESDGDDEAPPFMPEE